MQQTESPRQRRDREKGWRIYALNAADGAGTTPVRSGTDVHPDWRGACGTAAGLGFDTLSVPWEWLREADAVEAAECMRCCNEAGLRLMVDLVLPHGRPGAHGDTVEAVALPGRLPGELQVMAVSVRGLAGWPAERWSVLFDALRRGSAPLMITVWTPGMTPAQLRAMEPLGVDAVYSSLPWWDFRQGWLLEEYERLRAVAPVIAPLADPRSPLPQGPVVQDALRRLAVASMVSEGVLVPAGHLRLVRREPLVEGIALAGPEGKERNGPRRLTGSLAEITALFRGDPAGRLLLVNPSRDRSGTITRWLLERRLPNGFVLQSPDPEVFRLDGGEWSFVPITYAEYIAEHGTTSGQLRRMLSSAMRAPRIAIEAVEPTVDGGLFPAKRILGETIIIRANIFMDGHEELAAELLWRAANEPEWNRLPMEARGNDAWEARFTPRRLGRYVYMVKAWWDRWSSYCVQLGKKAAAGLDVSLEVEEGRRMLAGILENAAGGHADAVARIETALSVVGMPGEDALAARRRRRRPASMQRSPEGMPPEVAPVPPGTPGHVAALLDEALARAVHEVAERVCETETPVEYPLSVERNEALFSSWYELFPRSQSPVPGRHGTLRDVIARLPAIRRMGFDVLYFPPIHPIGRRNRKGRNNSLRAGPDDPGSPYAIGAPEGGHDAIHPELGTLDDFRALVAETQRHGMEIALDFAIQCSPDHPWLKEHPDWFNWRVDGTLKYAENPPKRYEDIVNPDFYSPLASTPRQAALWRALRDVVFFWVHQGVRIFRVDNPHTKPLPFWQWLLNEVRDRYPDTIFLSEAFTRPAMMYRLAKIGFSQSYTYFTWRNTKHELTQYLTELNSAPVRDFFRPNFFVNTPDINPWFLQTSGRPGFLIRAVLATTLSGSWGMYNGFELCVGDAVPGKEEYLNSEKYELRHWDMEAPGNIIEEITRLNRIRRSHPALQSHLGVGFHEVDNEHILFYSRQSAEGDSIVVVAVSLDPTHRQGGTIELPLWEWGFPDTAQLRMHDLFEDRSFTLWGRLHRVELSPERPFVIWALVRDDGGPA